MHLLLAHGTGPAHPHPEGGTSLLGLLAFALAGGLVLALVALELRWRKRDESRWSRYRRAVEARKRLLTRAGVIALALAAAAYGALAPEKAAPDRAAAETRGGVSEDSEFPARIVSASPTGAVVYTVHNDKDERFYVQCTLEALGEDGEPVLTGTYEMVDEQGNEVDSDTYAVQFFMDPGERPKLETNLRVSDPVADVRIDCDARPEPEDPGEKISA